MDEMYGLQPTATTAAAAMDDYSGKALMSPPENLILPPGADHDDQYQSLLSSSSSAAATFFRDQRLPIFGSDEFLSAASAISEAAAAAAEDEEDHFSRLIKAKIASHPSYPRLLQAYIECQKVGAPPEIARFLEEIRRKNEVYSNKRVDSIISTCCFGADPELDEFMETYCEMLVKYKSDLARPFDEATTFLNKIETQLSNLCTGTANNSRGLSDEGAASSDEEFSGGEAEGQESQMRGGEDRDLKDRLLRRFGGHISSLKLEFSKKKKKGKLPREARQTLLDWWNVHYKWPYPTEADKFALAETTGLDQKQINNWFINQRKRHWKPSENMQFTVMDNLSGQFYRDE